MIVLYGLRSCDRCRKALKSMARLGLEHRFHDLRADGLEGARLDKWLAELGWDRLLNRQSTTWRGLSDADRQDLDATSARALMLAHPTLIKRPVLELEQGVFVGFGKAEEDRLRSL